MAYAALVSVAQTIDLILNPHKFSISVDAKYKITCIRDSVIFVLSFLESYPANANRFEGQITDVANEAEDILEYFMWNKIQSNYKSMRVDVDKKSVIEFEYQREKAPGEIDSIAEELTDIKIARRFEGLIQYFKRLGVDDISVTVFEKQLEKTTAEVRSIAEELMDIKKSLRIEDDSLISGSPAAAVSSSTNVSTGENDVVIGLDDDLLAIKGRLCGESSKLEVIPIVGMGGIGKTTLTRNAYDDALIMERFHIRSWITVSLDYSVDEILSRLFDSMKFLETEAVKEKGNLSRQENETPIAEKVYKGLKGKRYLIVLDDVWSTKVWDDLRILFPDDHNGSRIMLTTRLSDVAVYPISEGSQVHEMKFMDENQSWNLLKQKVFTNSQDIPPELEDTGKAIARGCRGLPLAVVLVSGILPTVAMTPVSWKEIAKSVISVVDGPLEKILSLSYTHLPHHLRPCFLYIGGFPEDYEIHASRLIKLWVAEGFLKHEIGCKSLEEKAEECLEDLVKRSLILVTQRKATGEIKSCSLHDMVRDSCIRKAHEEKFLHNVMDRYNLQKSIKNRRRISTISHHQFKKIRSPTIRTFLCLRLNDNSSLPASVGGFRLLRVLDVVCRYVGFLPSQLFELIHLRYLALGYPSEIPATISNLHNLQTLIINPKSWGFLKLIPHEIWRMQKLRHLVLPCPCRLLKPVDGLTLPLENLQTLTGVTGLVCSDEILKMIPNLKKLEIVDVENEDNLQNLIHLHQLEKLKLSYSLYVRSQISAFPRTLRKLTLIGGHLPSKDMSVIGSLPNLQVLKLKDFAFQDGPSETWETTDGEFPELRFLLIQESRLEHWITESSHFPRLKSLVLRRCRNLREIPDGIGEIPTLELIEVDDINQSLADSAKQIQVEQLDYGNDTLQVRCVHVDWRSSWIGLWK